MSLVRLADEAVASVAAGQIRASEEAPSKQASSALDALVRYIPTEVVTLYVAALGAKVADAKWVYIAGAVATPTILALVIIGKTPVAQRSAALKQAARWPMWAATIAFLIWALAVPDSPLPADDHARVLAAFGAIFISTILSLLDPIFAPSS